MIEVVLALSILAVAIVSLVGLLGPTLNSVKTVTDTNAALSCIPKLSAILDAAPFYPGGTPTANQINYSVYTWIKDSTSTQPTVFFFYDNVGSATGVPANVNGPVITGNVGAYLGTLASAPVATLVGGIPYRTIVQMQADAQSGAINGAVIAMTISLSPLAAQMATNYYGAAGSNPAAGSMFPTGAGLTNANPNAVLGTSVYYPEAYLPILVQVFSVPVDQLASPTVFTPGPTNLNSSNFLFSYTTAKLR
jgi:hypothetical protein